MVYGERLLLLYVQAVNSRNKDHVSIARGVSLNISYCIDFTTSHRSTWSFLLLYWRIAHHCHVEQRPSLSISQWQICNLFMSVLEGSTSLLWGITQVAHRISMANEHQLMPLLEDSRSLHWGAMYVADCISTANGYPLDPILEDSTSLLHGMTLVAMRI